jgi:hypothetical protein
MRSQSEIALTLAAASVIGVALYRASRKPADGEITIGPDGLQEINVPDRRPWWLPAANAIGALNTGAAAVVETVKNAFLPRGIRNNNPGNIEWIFDVKRRWRGMVGRDAQAPRYAVFDTPANGVRAIGGELKASFRKGQRTVRAIINEWAPPTENDTSAYVQHVAALLAVQPDAVLETRAALLPLTLAIIRHENGQQPYNPADVAEWINS